MVFGRLMHPFIEITDTNTTSDQWSYLHENRIFIAIILILESYSLNYTERSQPDNLLSLMLHKLVFFGYHSAVRFVSVLIRFVFVFVFVQL